VACLEGAPKCAVLPRSHRTGTLPQARRGGYGRRVESSRALVMMSRAVGGGAARCTEWRFRKHPMSRETDAPRTVAAP